MANLEAVFAEDMQCPVCLDILRPPVRLCQNGHATCDDCHNKIDRTWHTTRCPLCRGDFRPDPCPVKEQLYYSMKVSCKFDGCKVKGYGREVVRHERRCILREVRCSKCVWEGPHVWLPSHHFTNHVRMKK
ncbi:hypothetical protein Zmor_016075 [Zophobas morio]|uniref:RING-type domain-containing protein n=1 Tax=Zophobas morio TaxID=2755281 RepID=A0AA38IJ41_9CUCU|nr:hypothetical protein Zmor_016075 [Zophobas morio]